MNSRGEVAHIQVLGKSSSSEPANYRIISNFDFFWGDVREWFDSTAGGGFGRPTRRGTAQRLLNASLHDPAGITAEAIFKILSTKYVLANTAESSTIFQAIINVEKGVWNGSIPTIPVV